LFKNIICGLLTAVAAIAVGGALIFLLMADPGLNIFSLFKLSNKLEVFKFEN